MTRTVNAIHFGPAGAPIGTRELRPPGPADVVVRVTHTSLNAGEIRPPNAPRANGWDLAGLIEDPGPSGLGVGVRVCGFSAAREAWAEQVVLPATAIAPIPDEVSSETAASLPVAAGTALAMVDAAGGGLVGTRALVLGATGGVGGFAVPLARLAGCRVTALVRSETQVDHVRALGAEDVLVGEIGDAGPFAFVAAPVGGPLLSQALGSLEPDGTAVVVGHGGGPEIAYGPLIGRGRARLVGLNLYAHSEVVPPRRWLTRLLALVAQGRLKPDVVDLGDWTNLDAAIARLKARDFMGKGVVRIVASQ